MSYVTENLMPGEQVVGEAKMHWIAFLGPSLALVLGLIMAASRDTRSVSGLLLIVALVWGITAAIRYATSEFAVTNRRVLAKVGLLHRRSIELNLAKLESVDVDQDILGRVFGFGTIVLKGTGGTREPFAKIADPHRFRLSIQNQGASTQLSAERPGGAREERDCPYCAERILAKARVCKHCGREVQPLA